MNELRDEIELPKLEWREMLAYEPVRCIEETCALEHAGEYEIRAEREAQLKSSLAANREQKATLADRDNHIDLAYKALGDVNRSVYLFDHIREQKAEIERLKADAEDWKNKALDIAESRHRLLAELVSLRASVGEKWIEVKEVCEVPEYGETIHAICTSGAMEPWQEVFEATFTMGWEEMATCGVTYWKRLKWPVAPTLPGEEK